MLKQRVVTALILIITLLAAIFGLPPFYFSLFMAAIILGAAWEWSALIGFAKIQSKIIYLLIFLFLLVLIQSSGETFYFWIMLGSIVWWCIALAGVFFYPRYSQLWGQTWVLAIIGGFVLLPGWASLLYLRAQPEFVSLILLFIALVIAVDIGAYFTGRSIGKRKLAVKVSPNKTWEGFWGGISASVVLICLIFSMSDSGNAGLRLWLELIVFAIVLGAISVVGDLLESMVKRFRHVKDSGNILPGHGGILDRIDSIAAAAPVYALFVMTAGNNLL